MIDLKTNKITHQDVGQMDMYIRMYDELKKSAEELRNEIEMQKALFYLQQQENFQ